MTLNNDSTTKAEKAESTIYERPRIEDYGTLAELTADKGPRHSDFLGGREDGGGGGYS